MKTGIVFYRDGDNALLLLNDGTFVQTQAGPGWEKGDIVRYRRKSFARQYWYAAACLALLLTGAAGGKLYFTESAVISMDINPSFEIGVNLFDRVVSVTPMNPEAERIVNALSIKFKSYEDAIRTILQDGRIEKYLEREKEITLSVSAGRDEEAMAKQVEETARAACLAEGEEVNVESFAVDPEDVEQAHHIGVTAGKYQYIKQLQQLGVDLDISESCHHSISQLKSEIDMCSSSHNDVSGDETQQDQQYKHSHSHSHCH